MDRKLYMVTLSKQGAYLGQLVTELNSALQALEQTLDEESSPALLQTSEPLQGLTILQECLATEADMLCQRLRIFLEESRSASRSPAK